MIFDLRKCAKRGLYSNTSGFTDPEVSPFLESRVSPLMLMRPLLIPGYTNVVITGLSPKLSLTSITVINDQISGTGDRGTVRT